MRWVASSRSLCAVLVACGVGASWHFPAPASAAPDAPQVLDAHTGEPRADDALKTLINVTLIVVGNHRAWTDARSAIASRRIHANDVRWQRVTRFDPHELLELDVQHTSSLRCWIDFTEPGIVRLYFANLGSERFLLRSLAAGVPLGELEREALAQIVELSTSAMLQDHQAGLSRQATATAIERDDARASTDANAPLEVRPDRPTSVAPSSSVRDPERDVERTSPLRPPSGVPTGHWEVAGLYAVTSLFDLASYTHGPALLVAGHWGGRIGYGAWVLGQYQFTDNWQQDLAGLQLQTTAVRAGLEVRTRFDADNASQPRFEGLSLRVGAGADFVHFAPQFGSADTSLRLEPERRRADPVFATTLEALTTLGSQLQLRAGAFVDAAPRAVRYDVLVDGAPQTAFAPLRVRPGLLVGLSVSL